jgi:FAD/FMN-containing dehydrogenase
MYPDSTMRVSQCHQASNEVEDFGLSWHVNILKPDTMKSEEFMLKCHKVDHDMMAMIQDLGGSVSAEHGVGLVKKQFLNMTRSNAEIELMKKIKNVFDPDSIMNPGKIFDIN